MNLEYLIQNIKQGNNPTFLNMYGTNPEILLQKSIDYSSLAEKFTQDYNQSEFHLFSSPGRSEIGGNHTDHQWGRVLAGAVNMDNIAVASANKSSIIRISSEGYPEIVVDLENLKVNPEKFYTSESLVQGICFRMNELGYKIGGFNACIKGGVPEGSGLSSSASFEVLIGTILSHLFNNGSLSAVENAKIGQWAENTFFGKPCGLMDQMACAVGGFITIDFEHPENPKVKEVNFDFNSTGYSLIITDTGGSHANLNEEYASLPKDMKQVAQFFDKTVLRQVALEQIIDAIPALRNHSGDRSILRALHFHGDNQRVANQVEALENNHFDIFLNLVNESGFSSYMYNQNVYCSHNQQEQGISLALALSEYILKGKGAWRVHGGGFAGTIQAFVPESITTLYIDTLEHAFGKGKCHKLFIRSKGSIKVEF